MGTTQELKDVIPDRNKHFPRSNSAFTVSVPHVPQSYARMKDEFLFVCSLSSLFSFHTCRSPNRRGKKVFVCLFFVFTASRVAVLIVGERRIFVCLFSVFTASVPHVSQSKARKTESFLFVCLFLVH